MHRHSPRVPLRRRLAVLPLLVLAALSARAASAGIDPWTPLGPGEGRVDKLAASSRGDLYAVVGTADVAEVWQLPAGAAAWRWRSAGLGRPRVAALAVHPKRPDELWAMSEGPIASFYRSDDAGASWRLVASAGGAFYGVSLSVVPAGSAVVLIAERLTATGSQLARSDDGGATWSPMRGTAPAAVAVDQPGVVYAAAQGGCGVLRSRDGGRTFRATRTVGVAASDELLALHVTRGRRPMVFASFRRGGLFRGVDGQSWEWVGFGGRGPLAISSSPDGRVIQALTPDGLSTSTRGGRPASFRLAPGDLSLLAERTSLVMTADGPLFAARGDVLGVGRAIAETGIQGFATSEVRVSAAEPNRVALRTFTSCFGPCVPRTLLSSDGGATFVHHGYALPTHFFAEVWDAAFDPVAAATRLDLTTAGLVLEEHSDYRILDTIPIEVQPRDTVEISAAGALLVGGRAGVQVSRDGGVTWTTTLLPTNAVGERRVVDLRADLGAPDRLLALAVEAIPAPPAVASKLAAYRSLDAGASWGPILPMLEKLLDVEAVPGSAGSLFALFAIAGGSELRRSDDGGMTAVPVHTFRTAESVSDVAVDAVAPDVLYAASATGLLRSRDGGATWEATPGTLDAWGSYRNRLQRLWVHPTERGHVFAAPADGGLFENLLGD